ncbi:serine/threonine-protein kinase [Nannocystis radixulma]|uniref:Tetratricopeptide repeat protein n=1 Tax=Nannocystis radixulma TaxID=2995305 RepID=A0ABT5B479_9BACT|nr:serine/threonine-protein kinase [Nannocystis radixulma]MDC0667927.1 tetratricopeptide repeat protein [Nannocystis radixulma]
MTDAGVDASERPPGLAQALPDSVDAELVRARLMTAMFGREAGSPRFGRFELRERIGEGGMGVVYRAFDPQLERTVAVKLIDTRAFPASQRERALREARSLARLAHPNVITVFEAGLTDDRVWIAMEYVPGTTMRDYLTRTPRPPSASILRHWIAVGRGLVAVHAAGLVHRDVKPSNVLIGDDGRARLIDFGLVHSPRGEPYAPGSTQESGASSDEAPRSAGTPRSAAFVGTRAYAAPEQLAGREVDAAADQYSLCVAIWESLAGRRPALADDATIERAPPRLVRALVRGLSLDPRARFGSLAELLAELEAVVAGPRRRLGLALGGAALGALVAGGAAAQLAGVPEPPPPCATDPEALAGTWDDARRAALRQRFAGSSLAFAQTTVSTLTAGFDAWAREWQEARRAACAATRIEGVQSDSALDLRNACLERKRRRVQVALDTLLAGDSDLPLAGRGPELLVSLPALADCSDPERLAQIEPLPAEGPARAAVLRGYDVLARADALAAAGALARAQASVDEFIADGPPPGYAPLRLELDAFPARLDLLREQTTRGVPALVAVAREAEARRLDELAATLRVEAAEAASGRWSKPELEQWLIDEADAALRRLGHSTDPRNLSLRVAEARQLAQAGRFADALAAHEQVRESAQQLGDDARAESQRLNIAAMLAQLGRHDDALAMLEAGHAAAWRRWGDGSPAAGDYAFDLALLAIDTGDLAGARARLDAAEATARAAFGDDSLSVARVEFVRTKLDMLAGEFATGLARLDAVIAVHERELGPAHELLGELHEARGVLRFFAGDIPGSIAAYQAALPIRVSVLGSTHPLVARLHSNLGESELALGHLDEARAGFERALAIYGSTAPTEDPSLALPLKGRGKVALAAGQPRQAVEDLERALALQLESGAEPLEIADLRFSLARALAADEGRRSPRARLLAREARADYAARDMKEQVAAIDAWLRG